MINGQQIDQLILNHKQSSDQENATQMQILTEERIAVTITIHEVVYNFVSKKATRPSIHKMWLNVRIAEFWGSRQ